MSSPRFTEAQAFGQRSQMLAKTDDIPIQPRRHLLLPVSLVEGWMFEAVVDLKSIMDRPEALGAEQFAVVDAQSSCEIGGDLRIELSRRKFPLIRIAIKMQQDGVGVLFGAPIVGRSFERKFKIPQPTV